MMQVSALSAGQERANTAQVGEMYRYIKYLGLTLIMLLGLYPIAELTRVIVVSGTYYYPEMDGQFAAEIAIMWLLYLSIIPIFLLINRWNTQHVRSNTRTARKQPSEENEYPRLINKNTDIIRVNYNK